MSKENINQNKYNDNEIKDIDNYMEIIEKQINFLKIKFNVFEENEQISENNFRSYLKCNEKILDNKELTKIYLDEHLHFKNLINEKDKLIKNLIKELKEKEEKIISLNKDILYIKKEKDYQQNSFQNIIKDLQFMQNGINTNLNLNLNPIKNSENKQKLSSYILKTEEYLSTEKSNKITEEEINNYSISDLITQNQNFLQQIDLLNKEKNGIESQLVIIKMKFAELSSSFNDEQDAKNEFKLKYEEANQNLLLKEDLIQKLLKQIEKEYTSNNNRNNKNHINNFVNNNNTNSSPLQTEPNFNSKNYKFKTEKNSNVFTSRLENNQFAFDNKNMKKEFYGLDDLDYNDDNYLTTIGINSNLTRKTEENYYNENEGGYSKTEHMENIKNYKELKKKEKTKSSIFGSIKGFFNK